MTLEVLPRPQMDGLPAVAGCAVRFSVTPAFSDLGKCPSSEEPSERLGGALTIRQTFGEMIDLARRRNRHIDAAGDG